MAGLLVRERLIAGVLDLTAVRAAGAWRSTPGTRRPAISCAGQVRRRHHRPTINLALALRRNPELRRSLHRHARRRLGLGSKTAAAEWNAFDPVPRRSLGAGIR